MRRIQKLSEEGVVVGTKEQLWRNMGVARRIDESRIAVLKAAVKAGCKRLGGV